MIWGDVRRTVYGILLSVPQNHIYRRHSAAVQPCQGKREHRASRQDISVPIFIVLLLYLVPGGVACYTRHLSCCDGFLVCSRVCEEIALGALMTPVPRPAARTIEMVAKRTVPAKSVVVFETTTLYKCAYQSTIHYIDYYSSNARSIHRAHIEEAK